VGRDVVGAVCVTHRGFKSWAELLLIGLPDRFVSACGWAKAGGDLLLLILEGVGSWRRQMGTFLSVIPGD